MAMIPMEYNTGVLDVAIQSYSTTVSSLAANGTSSVTFTGISKTGYTPLLAIYYKNDSSRNILPAFTAASVNSSGASEMAINNTSSSAYSNVTVRCYVIFVKK